MDGITERLVIEKADGVGRILLDNPEKRNAMTLEMWEDLPTVLEDFAADETVRVIVVAGRDGQVFCAGADISQFKEKRSDPETVAIYNTAVTVASDALAGIEKPTIAQIQGPCVGGGVGIALCCDLRLAAEGSKFAVPAAKLGIGYRAKELSKLVAVVGPSFAKEIFYTARAFNAEEALAMGLVNRVVEPDTLNDLVGDYTRRMSENAPLTLRASKVCINEIVRVDAPLDWDRCAQVVEDCFKSNDYQEGPKAFMEKRKPVFTGK